MPSADPTVIRMLIAIAELALGSAHGLVFIPVTQRRGRLAARKWPQAATEPN